MIVALFERLPVLYWDDITILVVGDVVLVSHSDKPFMAMNDDEHSDAEAWRKIAREGLRRWSNTWWRRIV